MRNMHKIHFLVIYVSLMLVSLTAMAEPQLKTVTLDVAKMTCSMCPITVKMALKKVAGVVEVSAKYEGEGVGWAKVTFDPTKVKVADLTFATKQAGYPSKLSQAKTAQ